MVVLLLFCLLKQLQGLIVSSPETLTSMVEVEQAGKTRLLLSSVSAQSWNLGRLPPTTLPDVVSCAAHCANLRQEDSCSCNAIVFVKENGDCIVGTARLPMKGEDTEKLFIVEGTGGWSEKKYLFQLQNTNLQMFGAGAPGQNTLGKHNIEIGLATRQLGSTRKIPLRSSIFRRIFKILRS